MATAEPLPSFAVLDHVVSDYKCVPEGEHKWATVRCESKHAYMCGEFGQSVVEGLTLLVRLAAGHSGDLYSALSISATENALSLLGAEVPEEIAEYDGRNLSLSSIVEKVDKNLVVFGVSFSTSGQFREFSLQYYLVYNSNGASLSMVPCPPSSCPIYYTRMPLPVRCGDGSDYCLVLMAGMYQRDVLCLWSPLSVPGDIGPWQIKDRRFPANYPRHFRADTVFSFKGKAFWADLAQGVLYCDCSALLNGANLVDFRFIEVPQGYRLHYPQNDDMGPMKLFRTMGSVGDCIWFVSVDQSKHDPRNTLVKVWTLDLSMEEWNIYSEFRLGNLWKLEDFKKAKLPKMVPEWPFLREQDDGVLCFVLPEKPPLSTRYYICGVDMRRDANRLLARPLPVSWIRQPIDLPLNFFEHLDPVQPRKRKVLAD